MGCVLAFLFLYREALPQTALIYPTFDYPAFIASPSRDIRDLFDQPAGALDSAGWYGMVSAKELVPGGGLRMLQGMGAFNCSMGTAGVGFRILGNADLSRRYGFLFYSRSLGRSFWLGVATGYSGFRSPRWKNKGYADYKISWAWQASNTLHFGGTIANPVVLKKAAERPAKAIHTGFTIFPSAQVSLRVGLLTDEGRGGRVLAGIEYLPEARVVLNAGWLSGETIFMFAAGYCYKNWKLSAGTTYHLLLGLSPQLSIHLIPAGND